MVDVCQLNLCPVAVVFRSVGRHDPIRNNPGVSSTLVYGILDQNDIFNPFPSLGLESDGILGTLGRIIQFSQIRFRSRMLREKLYPQRFLQTVFELQGTHLQQD